MKNPLLSIQTLLYQINDHWPKRNCQNDFIGENVIIINSDLDGRKNTAKRFVEELAYLAKDGKDDKRIKSISYNGQTASSEYKGRFWLWQKDQSKDPSLIYINLNQMEQDVDDPFVIPLFHKKEKKKENPYKFPGVSPLQYKKRNNSVRMMQNKLIDNGFFISDKELGYYGKETCVAVKQYYRKVLLMRSGTIIKDGKRFGPQGWERLFS